MRSLILLPASIAARLACGDGALVSQLANALPPLQRRSGLRATPQSYPKAAGIFIIFCTEGKHSVLMRVKTEKGIRFVPVPIDRA